MSVPQGIFHAKRLGNHGHWTLIFPFLLLPLHRFLLTVPPVKVFLPNTKNWEQLYGLNHHHHHVVPPARISLIISRHFSLSFITSGRSSGVHPVSSHSCCMWVPAGRPAFAWPYVGVHRSTSLTSSSLLLQQCPACLARLTCIVFVMGGGWPYSWRLVGCCRQDLFTIALNILV